MKDCLATGNALLSPHIKCVNSLNRQSVRKIVALRKESWFKLNGHKNTRSDNSKAKQLLSVNLVFFLDWSKTTPKTGEKSWHRILTRLIGNPFAEFCSFEQQLNKLVITIWHLDARFCFETWFWILTLNDDVDCLLLLIRFWLSVKRFALSEVLDICSDRSFCGRMGPKTFSSLTSNPPSKFGANDEERSSLESTWGTMSFNSQSTKPSVW